MQRRPLGATGLQVSALGLGAASFGGAYGQVDDAESIAAVHRAFALGVTLFDTSPYYGGGRAEAILGRALRALPRDQYVLVTKCGRYGPDAFDFAPARLRQSLAESLQRLGTDHVDVLLLHDVEFAPLDATLTDGLRTLRELQQSGRVRHVGFSGLPLRIFHRALELGLAFDAVISYCHGTLFDHTLLPLCGELAARGVGVLNASPAAMGLLSNQGPPDWHPAPPALRAACRRAAAVCAAAGVELAELALAHAVRLPGPAATLTGAKTRAEVERSVQAASAPPDPALLAAVLAELQPIRDQTWPQGRPENR